MTKVKLYTKLVKTQKTNEKGETLKSKFPVFLTRYKEKTFTTTLSNDCKAKLEKEMTKRDIEYPIALELNENDKHFFIVTEKKTLKDGSLWQAPKICIMDYVSMEQDKFEPTKTLDEIVEEMAKRHNSSTEDAPF